MLVAGDIGGTKTILAVFEAQRGGLRVVREETFHSREYESFDLLLERFLSRSEREGIHVGCFGVPGIVIDGRCHATNLPWTIDEKELAARTRLSVVRLINDLAATALGMLVVPPDRFEVIYAGKYGARAGNRGVIAAGTGLGEAILYWNGSSFEAIACEAGHADFAPRTALEIELLRYLRGMLGGHVSYERVISGPGIRNIYRFLRDSGYAPEAAWVAERLNSSDDPSAVISQIALEGRDELCRMTIDLFCTLYGAEAGNLALRCLAVGGIYVGGGIAPKLKKVLTNGSFVRGFLDKGRLSSFVEQIPVFLSLEERTALLGAAYFAQKLIEKSSSNYFAKTT